MIKFLIYLFLIYLLYRLVFGRAMGNIVKTKVYRYDTHHHYHATKEEPEGNITVNPKINKDKTHNGSKNIGEYVDYEEVK